MVLANLKDNIDWFEARQYAKTAEKFCGNGKFDVVVDRYSNILCLWISLSAMQMFTGRVLDPCPTLPALDTYLIPETRLKFALSYPFHPYQKSVSCLPQSLYSLSFILIAD